MADPAIGPFLPSEHDATTAVQGGGYVVAGLARLVWLKERPGEPSGAGAQRRGRPELVGAEG